MCASPSASGQLWGLAPIRLAKRRPFSYIVRTNAMRHQFPPSVQGDARRDAIAGSLRHIDLTTSLASGRSPQKPSGRNLLPHASTAMTARQAIQRRRGITLTCFSGNAADGALDTLRSARGAAANRTACGVCQRKGVQRPWMRTPSAGTPAVPGVGMRTSWLFESRQSKIDGVLPGHHLLELPFMTTTGLVDACGVRGPRARATPVPAIGAVELSRRRNDDRGPAGGTTTGVPQEERRPGSRRRNDDRGRSEERRVGKECRL